MDPTPSEIAVADEDVEGSRPVACWSVREGDWCDELPDEVAALLAPPVVVSAEASVPAAQPPLVADDGAPTAQPRSTPDNGLPVAYSPRHAAPEGTTRLITPSLPRRLRRRRSAHAA
jgi:hypothetical protein